jgi:hypothetical protein
MTRKDYVRIAAILSDARTINLFSAETVDRLVEHFARMLAADNPRFDPDRFAAACQEVR